MKVIEQTHEILMLPDRPLKIIEKAGRTCYKSEHMITDESGADFFRMLAKRGHHAMLEFSDVIVKFITNRGVTHELVRHRMCSFAQESTRYVRYDGEMEFIKPVWFNDKANISDVMTPERIWLDSSEIAEENYKHLLNCGWRPEQAREVLPNSLKTEIVVKANVREWRHIFGLRCSKAAHPQMRDLMVKCRDELRQLVPVVFD